MRREVSVTLSLQQEYRFDLQDQPAMGNEEARGWLDTQFVALECEPLRASGKLLTADKVLTVALAAGAVRFADPQWSMDFARATSAALGRPLVQVDVPSMAITY